MPARKRTAPPLPTAAARVRKAFREGLPADCRGNRTLLAAVSGGADSTALLHLLCELRDEAASGDTPFGRIVVAHFQHGLRGTEADGDQAFTAELAARLGCGFVTAKRAEQAVSAVGKRGRPDSEGAARADRYAFLRSSAEACGARYVLTGHTADDRIETILHHILRGTGLAGLGGMPAVRELGEASLVRPLLGVRRDLLREYLAEINATHREDSSNAGRRYLRNRLRLDLLPLLERDFDPAIGERLLRLGEIARDAADALRRQAEGLYSLAVEPLSPDAAGRPTEFRIDPRALADVPRAVVQALLERIWHAAGWDVGEMRFRHWRLLTDRLLPREADAPEPPAIELPGRVTVRNRAGFMHLRRAAPSG